MRVKFSIYLLFTIFLCFNSYSQDKTKFYKEINTLKSKELKLNILDSIFYHHDSKDNYQEAVNYGIKYIDLAYDLKQYKKAIEKSIKIFYTINILLGERDKAMKLIKKSERHISKIKDSFLIGSIYLNKAGGYFNGTDFKKAIDNYQLAIQHFGKKDSIHVANAIFFKGKAEFKLGNFLNSMNDYKLASLYYESLGDKVYVFNVLSSIISIYGSNGFIEEGIQERQNLINKRLNTNFLEGINVNYYNQYVDYKELNNFSMQELNLLKSLEYTKKNKDSQKFLPIVYSALSQLYLTRDRKKSRKYLNLASKAIEGQDISTSNYNYYKFAEAKYLAMTKKSEGKALNIYYSILKEENKSGNFSLIKNIKHTISKTYELKRDYKNALKYYKEYTSIKDSIVNRKKINAFAYYQALYDSKSKELKISNHKNEIKLLKSKLESRKRWFFFVGIAMIFFISSVLLYRNSQYFKRKNELRAFFSQNLLLSQDEERERISRDLHDSLGQSLLLVKSKISNNNIVAKNLVNNTIEEMRSISRSIYPCQLKHTFGITKGIQNYIRELDENYKDIFIFDEFDDDFDGMLTKEQEFHLFRIIQESMSNIIKHSKAKSAKVQLKRQKNKLTLMVKDNGVGFSFIEKIRKEKSLGLKTIKERVSLLKGELKVSSKIGGGSELKVSINIIT